MRLFLGCSELSVGVLPLEIGRSLGSRAIPIVDFGACVIYDFGLGGSILVGVMDGAARDLISVFLFLIFVLYLAPVFV